MKTDQFDLTEEQEKELTVEILSHYRKNLEILKPAFKDRESSVQVSSKALKTAMNSIINDINILLKRRKPKNFISKGKIAGIVLYRLSKNHVLHTENTTFLNDPIFLGLNSLVAILVALNYVKIPYSNLPDFNKLELIYSLNKRHVNQETLGLIFDFLCYQN